MYNPLSPKKHGLSTNFLVENLLNACLGSSTTEKPLTGFSESQEQLSDEQILPELSDDSLDNDSNFELSLEEESGSKQDSDIVVLFKKKDVDVDSCPGVVK